MVSEVGKALGMSLHSKGVTIFLYDKVQVESQVGVMVISHAIHLNDLGLFPRLRMWAEICQSQSDFEGFSLGTLVFLALQI
mgnify:CR=1 FL=1